MAGLPGSNAKVRVGPPLNCRGPSLGSPDSIGLQLPSWIRLWLFVPIIAPLFNTQSPPLLPATMVFRKSSDESVVVTKVLTSMPPPPVPVAVFKLKVQLVTATGAKPNSVPIPPPPSPAELPLKVQLVTDRVSALKIPPPFVPAELLAKVQLVTDSLPKLAI